LTGACNRDTLLTVFLRKLIKIKDFFKPSFCVKFAGKILEKISKEKNYCKAEEYHQKYFQKKTKK